MASAVVLISLSVLLAIGFAYIRRHEDDRAWMLWGLSWLALIASIVLGAIATPGSLTVLPWTDTAYAALMLGAAFACTERRIPRWVVPVAAAIAFTRSGLRATDAFVPYLTTTAVSLGAVYLYGGFVLWTGSAEMRGVRAARMLAGAYAALALLTAWVQWTSSQTVPLSQAETALANAVLVGAIFGLALLELLVVTGRAREREQAATRARMSDLEVLAALAELGNTEDDTRSLLHSASFDSVRRSTSIAAASTCPTPPAMRSS